jgi:Dolichyl-phosphate-mannose-protein mannosyltransferase
LDAVTFALALAAVALAGGLGAAALRPRSVVSFCLAAYVIASTIVVALTELLSVNELVGARGFGVGVAVALAGAAAVWLARGGPRPPHLRLPTRTDARAHPVLVLLGVVVAVAAVYELLLVLTTPPNNGDSLTYHLTRAAAWYQHGGIYRIPGTGHAAENDYPANAEIQILFSFAFLHGDRVAALTQFIAQGVAVIAVYGIARRLEFAPASALLAALLTPTLAQIALQSVTTQNDLVAGALVAAAAYFLHARERVDVWLAGLSLGLAIGTKLTVLFALPALAVIALVSLRWRAVAAAAAAAAIGFAAVGSGSYVRNLADAGTPIGALEGEPGLQRPVVTAAGTISSVARYTYGLADFAGYPLDYRDLRIPTAIARKTFESLGIPQNPPESTGYPFGFAFNVRSNEDIAFFGPLGLILIPLGVWSAFRFRRGRVGAERAAHAVVLPLYLLALALGYRYSGQGRFLITPVLLTLPLAASIYGRRGAAVAVSAVAAVSLALAHAHSEAKPTGLRGTQPVWEMPRTQAQGLQAASAVPYLVERLEQQVPARGPLGIVVDEHDADYVLYGPRLQRRLVPLPADGTLTAAERAGLRWVYVGRAGRVPQTAPGWRVERLSDAGTLLSRR